MIDDIATKNPDVVFVAMGSPKQELFGPVCGKRCVVRCDVVGNKFISKKIAYFVSFFAHSVFSFSPVLSTFTLILWKTERV